MNGFFVPASCGESEIVEKRSRFLGHLRNVHSEEEAKAFIQECKRQYHDARHNCWCYRIYNGPERFSDDGEPQGSAGMPMLEVLRREQIVHAVCVITRYFGGVLLGTGGLSRAYSASAKEALLSAGIAVIGEWAELSFSCSYASFERIKKAVFEAGGFLENAEYGTDICISAVLPWTEAEAFCSLITEISAGNVTPAVSGPVLRNMILH